MKEPSATSKAPIAAHVAELKQLASEAGLLAVQEAVARASIKTLAAVVTAMSDPHGVLMLLAADIPPAPHARLIAEATARSRTASFRARLSDQAGGMLDRREVAEMLGVSPATVGVLRRRREILGVRFGREIRYPGGQFLNGKTLAGLQRILMALGDMEPWVMLQSLLVPLTGFAPAPTSMLTLLRNGVSDDEVAKLCGLARSWAS